MTDHSQQAADTVLDTIRNLVASGQRAYSHNVPTEAASALVRKGAGTIQLADAERMIKEAIVRLLEEGRLKASAEPHVDWTITP
jgi:hypothetical protein